MSVLCRLGLHDWVVAHYTFDEEVAFFRIHGHLPPVWAHCRRCTATRMVAR